MNFGAPAMLWGLLVLPLIIALYMLRTRRHDIPVSSLLLWQRARRDLAAQRPARRFERSLLLLLQLLAAALLVLALARPQLRLPGGAADATVIVMDTSASMQAVDEQPSRFGAAVAQARHVVDTAPGEVMVIESGALPRIAATFGDAGAAQRVLAGLRPSDGPSRLDQAVTLALGQRRPGRLRVHVFTDRAGATLPGVTYHVVGSQSRNVGIASVAVERSPGGSVLVVQMHNSGPRAERVPVVVFQGSRRLVQRTVTVAGGALASVALPVAAAGLLRVELAASDLLAVDNVAHAITDAPPPRVIVAGAPNRVLKEALAAIPVRFAPVPRITPDALAAADVVILSGTAPVDLPPGNYLLLGTTAPNLPLTVIGRVRAPQVLRWSVRHPVMRSVDLDGLAIGEAWRFSPRGGEVLAEGESPLLWAYEGQGVRAIVSAFALDQSDLPLRVAFPILLQNALTWLSGTERLYRAGDSVLIPAGSLPEAELLTPDGTRVTVAASGGRFVIASADRTGLYVLRAGRRAQRFVVNPSPEEITLGPVRTTSSPAARAAAEGREPSNAWIAALLLVVAVLCVEWWVWLRALPRSHGWRRETQRLRPGRPS